MGYGCHEVEERGPRFGTRVRFTITVPSRCPEPRKPLLEILPLRSLRRPRRGRGARCIGVLWWGWGESVQRGAPVCLWVETVGEG